MEVNTREKREPPGRSLHTGWLPYLSVSFVVLFGLLSPVLGSQVKTSFVPVRTGVTTRTGSERVNPWATHSPSHPRSFVCKMKGAMLGPLRSATQPKGDEEHRSSWMGPVQQYRVALTTRMCTMCV